MTEVTIKGIRFPSKVTGAIVQFELTGLGHSKGTVEVDVFVAKPQATIRSSIEDALDALAAQLDGLKEAARRVEIEQWK